MENEPWVARGSGRERLDGDIEAQVMFVPGKLFAFNPLDVARNTDAVGEKSPGNGGSVCGGFPHITPE
jgi:hypothetical protein